jgi:hypothetical protein
VAQWNEPPRARPLVEQAHSNPAFEKIWRRGDVFEPAFKEI